MSNKIKVRCNICENEWEANPQHLIRGHGCPKCALKNRRTNNTLKTHKQFVEELNEINPNIKIISQYKNARTKIGCECLVCGNVWASKPDNLLSGYGCKVCGNKSSSLKQRKRKEEFINELEKIDNTVNVIGNYINNRVPILCECKICGRHWEAIPSNLLKGEGCPYHNNSHGENKIAEWLDKHNIKYTRQMRFDDLRSEKGRTLPYDFYIESLNLFIEYQGNFHNHTDRMQSDEDYLNVCKRDELKKSYAEAHGQYLDIWYYENLEEKLLNVINNITDPVTTTVS